MEIKLTVALYPCRVVMVSLKWSGILGSAQFWPIWSWWYLILKQKIFWRQYLGSFLIFLNEFDILNRLQMEIKYLHFQFAAVLGHQAL